MESTAIALNDLTIKALVWFSRSRRVNKASTGEYGLKVRALVSAWQKLTGGRPAQKTLPC